MTSLPLYFFCYYLLSSSRVGYLVGYLLFLIPGCYDLFGYVYRCCYIIALRSLDAIYFHVTYDEIYTPLRLFLSTPRNHKFTFFSTLRSQPLSSNSAALCTAPKSNQIKSPSPTHPNPNPTTVSLSPVTYTHTPTPSHKHPTSPTPTSLKKSTPPHPTIPPHRNPTILN